jgi:hypothetical protein
VDREVFPLLSIGGFLYVENIKNPIIIAIAIIAIAIITIDTTLHPCQATFTSSY